jgi:hypothetical protein
MNGVTLSAFCITVVTIYGLQIFRRIHARKRVTFREMYVNPESPLANSLVYYEYTLHHRLRASLARARGLAQLLLYAHSEQERKHIQNNLIKNLDEMDQSIKAISTKLNENNKNTKSNLYEYTNSQN